MGGPDTDDDFDDAGGRVQNWPKVDDVICARSLSIIHLAIYIVHTLQLTRNGKYQTKYRDPILSILGSQGL